MAERDNPEGLKIGNRFMVGRYVAGGSFGRLHLGKNITTNEEVAIKLELKKVDKPQLVFECRFYRKLGNNKKGIPKLYYFGECGPWTALIMEFLGPTLDKMHEKCGLKFSLKTTCQLALQLMDIFQYFHGKGIVYRDTKPENFLLGVTQSDKYNIVHIIDLGLCKDYIDEETNTHIPYVEGKGVTGTVRYMSINNHFGREQSRRDDLEAIGYMLVYFMKGELPWQGIIADSIKLKYKEIAKIKSQTRPEVLCNDLPEQFSQYLTYARNLQFTEEPRYQFLSDLFNKMLTKAGLQRDEVYDFDRNHRPRKR